MACFEMNGEGFSAESLDCFTEQLSSSSPVPGGGGAAAAMGALAACLCSMAANLTRGKKKFAPYEEDYSRILAACEELRSRFLKLIDADAEAFAPLSALYAIPKVERDPEKFTCCTLQAAAVPMEMLRCAAKTTGLLLELREKCSVLLISDVACGASAAAAAMECAAINVYVNTSVLREKPEAAMLEQEAGALMAEYLPKARELSRSIRTALAGKEEA